MSSQSSQTSHLRSQMARAADLEAQLASLPPKTSEEKASRLRIQLCEVLSDVMLTDPQFALRKDCSGRLWRNCFYSRIGELRSRISRHKRKNSPSLPRLEHRLEQSLKTFLKEAIKLYDYLVKMYESKLLPPSSSELSQGSTDTTGVVPGLHRILIHLGDLHRYSNAFGAAEKCYDKASKLAPGKGNPYNQLAVVAQLKDPSAPLSCVALFYYARSLMASHDPFETSKANLARLLEGNRDWLETTSEEPMLASSQSSDKARAQKTVQSRLFLARFVDLHYDFFGGSSKTSQDALVDKIETLLQKFEIMLKEWAFGDALLSKMVAINAFSVQWSENTNVTLAKAFMLRFGAALAERLERGVKKAMEKNTPSVRLLLPLVLLCDYVATRTDDPDITKALGTRASEFYKESEQNYWNQIASVATQLSHLSISTDEAATGSRLKEYDNLRGFVPFESFVDPEAGDVYLSVDEAVDVLDLRDASSTQDSTSTFTQSSASGPEENAIKLKHFFDFADSMVKENQLVRTGDGAYRVFSAEIEENPIIEDDETMEKNPIVESYSTKDAPMLEYKQPEDGTGPALLVPGALLVNKAQEASATATATATEPDVPDSAEMLIDEPFKEHKKDSFENLLSGAAANAQATVTTEERSTVAPALGPPPGIMPPPGFGAPAPAASSLGAFGAPAMQPAPATSFAYPAAPTGSQPPGFAQPAASQDEGQTVLDMLRGETMNSANPFLVAPAPAPASRLFSAQPTSNLFTDDDMDGTSLLDSGLLNSMLMDDSGQPRSKNPFLT